MTERRIAQWWAIVFGSLAALAIIHNVGTPWFQWCALGFDIGMLFGITVPRPSVPEKP